MLPENLDMSSITDARRKAIKETIKPIAIEDIKALEEELFPYHDDAWRERFSNFVQENKSSSFYHARTNDQVHILYCHTKEKGIWYLPGTGLGPLQEKGLKILKEIVENA
jgi:hypothetical protein